MESELESEILALVSEPESGFQSKPGIGIGIRSKPGIGIKTLPIMHHWCGL